MTEGMESAYALMTELRREVALEEFRVSQSIDAIKALQLPFDEEKRRLTKEWSDSHAKVRPVRDHLNYIIQKIAQIEAMKPPAPIFISPRQHLPSKP